MPSANLVLRTTLAAAGLCIALAAARAQPAAPPRVLDRPVDRPAELPPGDPADPKAAAPVAMDFFPGFPPLGFTGKSSVLPSEYPTDLDYIPVEDRWRSGFPYWNRDGKRHFIADESPYSLGRAINPFFQNALKGDYPVVGQHTFFVLTATDIQLTDTRQVPTATTPFESTTRARREEFFGSPNQLANLNFLRLQFELFHGDTAAFKPIDWRVRVAPIINANTLNVDELAIVNPDVRRGTQRLRNFTALEEYFIEAKLADLSPDYDFVSARVGSQFFTSDFRGFLFSDTNRAVRLFGTRLANRDQFNLAVFRQAEKDTNSALNNYIDREQTILIANYFRQDFIFPGFTVQGSVHYNNDPDSFKFDRNRRLVRPDPAGVFRPHTLDVVYFGLACNGHIDRYNITGQLYYALGRDTINPIANKPQDIGAAMAALELSYDRDWMRFRTSFFWASGDSDPNNNRAGGFDTIFDNPAFAGGQFSYWQRQAIGLFGVNLTNAGSLVPNLRSSKIQGQSNFVNPGLLLFNIGFDADVTPRLKWINNTNFLWFNTTEPLEVFLFDGAIHTNIGADISSGVEYRPLLSNNVIVTAGASTLIPGTGFRDLYKRKDASLPPFVAGFLELVLTY